MARVAWILVEPSLVQIDITVVIYSNDGELGALTVKALKSSWNKLQDEFPTSSWCINKIDFNLLLWQNKHFGHECMEDEMVISFNMKTSPYWHFRGPRIGPSPIGSRCLPSRDPL